jgi:hypothetical protein
MEAAHGQPSSSAGMGALPDEVLLRVFAGLPAADRFDSESCRAVFAAHMPPSAITLSWPPFGTAKVGSRIHMALRLRLPLVCRQWALLLGRASLEMHLEFPAGAVAERRALAVSYGSLQTTDRLAPGRVDCVEISLGCSGHISDDHASRRIFSGRMAAVSADQMVCRTQRLHSGARTATTPARFYASLCMLSSV